MSRIVASLLVLGLSTPALASRLQVVHLSPDAPNVDIWVDGAPVLEDVPYLAASPSLFLAPDAYAVDVTPAGTESPVISADLDLEPRTRYTVAAIGEVANIAPVVLENDRRGLAPGDTRLQVTHAAVGVGTVDVWELGSGTMILDDFEFGASGRIDVPAGALELGLDLDQDAVPDLTFSVPDLGAGRFVNVFAINDDAGPALYAVYVDGTTARVDAN